MKRIVITAALMSALGVACVLALDSVAPSELNQGARTGSVPVSQSAGWVALTTDTDGAHGPMLAEADSGVVSSGVVVAPSLITRTDQSYLYLAGRGTSALVRFKYATSATGVTGPTVQIFGRRLDGSWQRLTDGSGVHTLALTVDTANDVQDGTDSYTQPVVVDAMGCDRIIVAINTVASGTGLTGCAIQGSYY